MNSHLLKGLKCPRCPFDGPLRIQCRAFFLVGDYEVLDYETPAWSDKSLCICPDCGNAGTVEMFKRKPPSTTAVPAPKPMA